MSVPKIIVGAADWNRYGLEAPVQLHNDAASVLRWEHPTDMQADVDELARALAAWKRDRAQWATEDAMRHGRAGRLDDTPDEVTP